jgi:hypothetical protein
MRNILLFVFTSTDCKRFWVTIKSRDLHPKTIRISVHLYAPLFFILSHFFWFGFLRFFRVPINDSYNIDTWYAGRSTRKKRKFCTWNYLSVLQGYVKPILKKLLAISSIIAVPKFCINLIFILMLPTNILNALFFLSGKSICWSIHTYIFFHSILFFGT